MIENSQTLPSVYVGIPAHNEAGTIAGLLQAVVAQSQTNFRLEAVVVACDGCTDSTAEVVREIASKNPLVSVIDDGLRLGKTGRLNNFFRLSYADILVLLDGDIDLAGSQVLAELVSAFNNPEIGLVGGRGVPAKPTGFAQKMAATCDELWYEVRKNLNHGDSIYNLVGCIMALSKLFYQNLQMVKGIVAEDEFIFFKALESGFDFKFAKTALAMYQSPASLKDFFVQSTRFISTREQIEELFGPGIGRFYVVPMGNKIKALLVTFFRHPIYLPTAVFFQILLRLLKPWFKENNKDGLWTRVESTKKNA